MNGNIIIVKLGNTVIGAVKSNEIGSRCDVLEYSAPGMDAWRYYYPGMKTWEVSVSYLLLSDSDLHALLSAGTVYTLTVADRNTDVGVTGSAILVECRIAAQRGNLVQGSFHFVGTGVLEETTVE